MELKDIFALIGPIIGGLIAGYIALKVQEKKTSADIDLEPLKHALDRRLMEFESTLTKTNSYLAEKGKNDATKEDLEEINRKLEAIRTDFSKKGTLFRIQAEKEYVVYSKIWALAIELKFAVEGLRPLVDFYNSNETARERNSKRYDRVLESGRKLLLEVERQRPFYPEALFLQLHEVLQRTNEEIVDFEFSLDEKKERMSSEGYKTGQKNLQEITQKLNQVCDLMRKSIRESE